MQNINARYDSNDARQKFITYYCQYISSKWKINELVLNIFALIVKKDTKQLCINVLYSVNPKNNQSLFKVENHERIEYIYLGILSKIQLPANNSNIS